MTETTKSAVPLQSDRFSAETDRVKIPLSRDYFKHLKFEPKETETYRAEATEKLCQGRLTRSLFNHRDKEWKFVKRLHDIDIYRDISQQHNPACVVVAVGTIQGKMEDLIHGEYTETTPDFRRKSTFVDPKVVRDCHVLHCFDTHDRTKQSDGTFQFLGLKYIQTRVPVHGVGRLIKGRDYTFTEHLGITTSPEPAYSNFPVKPLSSPLGYHIMHTCTLPDVPEFPNIIRGQFSVTNMYQQISPGVVRMYSRGIIDPAGEPLIEKFMIIHCINLVTRAFKILQLAECQKLTCLLNDAKGMSTTQSTSGSTEENHTNTQHQCSLCPRRVNYQMLGFFVKAKACDICNILVCSKCRVKKDVINEQKKNSIRCCPRCLLHSKDVIPISASGSEAGRFSQCSSRSSGALSATMNPTGSLDERNSMTSYPSSLSDRTNYAVVAHPKGTEKIGIVSPIFLHKLDEEEEIVSENWKFQRAGSDVDAEFTSCSSQRSWSDRSVRSFNSTDSWGKSSSSSYDAPRSSHKDQIYQQMLALQRAAEIAYNTTQANRNISG
uniref:Uncharacterized protein AlNc14C151G7527 n=1 Tax=Albugo laibachii Nc14 TaxID=890382 RepID=F0WM16_9STRA|nr:conserved hypothetical protein [Albugo laibachii Nc14]|eukprot:CCA22343.1 conserved hypothetical protein [Albugo laibachii Nc14]